MRTFIFYVLPALLILQTSFGSKTLRAQEQYLFETIKKLDATSVKSQGRTGTCWVFSTLSMMESELMRMGKGEFDLSEMFIVRQSYIDRAELYMRFHGNLNFGPGAQAWDVLNVLKEDGVVPQQVLPGFKIDEDMHNHGEMDALLKSFVQSIAESGEKLSPVWDEAYEGVLDAYLGDYPEKFNYQGESYTPSKFLDYLGIEPSDYVPFTSFMNHDYYSSYVFESPDNWSMEEINNVPPSVMIEMMKTSIKRGYTLAWAADVSDPGFRDDLGLAIVPEKDWDELSEEEQQKIFREPVEQRKVTEEMRQKEFDNYSTTDDHLMHIVGLAEGPLNTDYFIVKNSWGTGNPYGGYLYVSESYVKLRTTSILLNKDALNGEIKEKFAL
jgi:bleomycin hydrolase